jgi:hypothetical protein
MPEIPDIGLSRIEGYNGVGKSSGIRLLQLCTGDQPYEREARAWASLTEQLESATVIVSNLDGAQTIEWSLSPSGWPDKPVSLDESNIGSVRIDGRLASMKDVQELLRVHRLVGNETLTETLAQQCDNAAAIMHDVFAENAASVSKRSRLDHRLADVEDIIPNFDAPTFRGRQRKAAEAKSKAAENESRMIRAKGRLDLLVEALKLFDQLDEVQGQGPGLDQQLAAIDDDIPRLERESAELDEEIERVAQQQRRDEEAQEEFDKAKRLLTRRQSEVQEIESLIRLTSGSLGIGTTQEAAEAAFAAAEQRMSDLDRQALEAHAGPAMSEILGAIAESLRKAEAAGLGDEVLIAAESGTPAWTVETARIAFEREAQKRAEESPSESAEAILEQKAKQREYVGKLQELLDVHRRLANTARLYEAAVTRFNNATAAMPDSTVDELRRLLQRKSDYGQMLREQRTRREQISQARTLLGGGQTVESLERQLTAKCIEADVDVARLQPALRNAREVFQSLEELDRVLSAEAQGYEEELAKALRDIASAVEAMNELSWIPAAIMAELAAARQPEEQIAVLRKIADQLEVARTRLERVAFQPRALADALTNVAQQFRGNTASGTWVPVVHAWMSGKAQEWFNHKEVRSTLFDSAESVFIDLKSMEARWDLSGEERVRSLQAFSSGQQAFAYTRARLSLLDQDPHVTRNRLIALDEFGALIAANGMRTLAAYLRERRVAAPQDQIAVVLPLTERLGIGDEPESHESFEEAIDDPANQARRRQLQRRGYFVEELV